ncbi:MAG: glutamate 5-kinase [Negativicutes bacterium]|jgi:glutamate 5-kinase
MKLRAIPVAARRIVIKIGTSSLSFPNGMLDFGKIERLVRAISNIHNSGREIILVTSGAVGAGMMKLGLKEKPTSIPEKQAVAAVGQGLLMHVYEKIFSEYAKTVAQVLLTRSDTQEQTKCANSRSTLLSLLRMNVIPIINENDAVSIDELKIGDNDNLSAMVAALVEADLLLILSDVDGLFTANPSNTPSAKLISEIKTITIEIENMAGDTGTFTGTGGMNTKIQAAKIAVNAGVAVIIANSGFPNVIESILDGQLLGTLFLPKKTKLQFRKKWLSFGKAASGKIFVDKGCGEAIVNNGSSLLPVGIIDIDGDFTGGQVVSVISSDNQEIARGLINYSACELRKIKGKKINHIAAILGGVDYHEAIHRDNMVVIV